MIRPGPELLDDVVRVAGGAMGVLAGVRSQILRETKDRLSGMAGQMDLVPRDDFERIETMVKTFRTEQEKIKARLDALEAALTPGRPSAKKAAARKAAPKKAARPAPAKKRKARRA